ncbi:MAG: hypothetical protein IJP03_03295, partial [Christensenellaceae bacterium]|nr:hypothetical protein [Christensenellaceae bacterium]
MRRRTQPGAQRAAAAGRKQQKQKSKAGIIAVAAIALVAVVLGVLYFTGALTQTAEEYETQLLETGTFT